MGFIGSALFALVLGLILRSVFRPKGKDGKRVWKKGAKKYFTVFLYFVAVLFTVSAVLLIITFAPRIYGIAKVIINLILKQFRNPDLTDLLLVVIAWIQGALLLILCLFAIVGAMVLWIIAYEFKTGEEGLFSKDEKSKEDKKSLKSSASKPVTGTLTEEKGRLEKIKEKIAEKIEESDTLSVLIANTKIRVSAVLKKRVFPRRKKKKIKVDFWARVLAVLFWFSVFFAWAAYQFYTLAAFSVFFVILSICAVILLIRDSFPAVDRLVLGYLKQEIKSLPGKFFDMWKLAFGSLLWTVAGVFLYLILFKQLQSAGMSSTFHWAVVQFLRIFVLVYCIRIVVYSIKKIKGPRTGDLLGGVSTAMCIWAGYYDNILPKTWGTVVFWVYYLLGFAAGFFMVGQNLKKFYSSKGEIKKREFMTGVFKFFAIVMFSAVVLGILFNFIVLGTYPGTSDVAKACAKNLNDGLDGFFKSTDVFREFTEQAKKGLEKADLTKISAVFHSNPNIRKVVDSFTKLRKNAAAGMRSTWHSFNLFNVYYWTADSMLSLLDYMYECLPSFFSMLQQYAVECKHFVAVFENSKGDLKKLEAGLSTPAQLANRRVVEKLLKRLIDCNNRYEKLKPTWVWRIAPNFGKDHKFMVGMEGRLWVFLNYEKLKRLYKDDYIVVKRTGVIHRRRDFDFDHYKESYGDLHVFPFDEKIIIYSGIGDLNLD